MRAIIAILLLSMVTPAFAWQIKAPPKNFSPIPVQAIQCGIAPIPPIGCRGPGSCVCNGSGQCQWVFNC